MECGGGARGRAQHGRFSVMWLTVGFAAPGLVRFVRALPAEARLIQAFVSAHLVHFATVS